VGAIVGAALVAALGNHKGCPYGPRSGGTPVTVEAIGVN